MDKLGCLLAHLSKSFTEEIERWAQDTIMPSDMQEQEFDTHVTVLYGFTDTTDSNDIINYCKSEIDRFTIELGNISAFSNEEHDVLKIEVISKELQAIHYDLREQFNPTITHQDYKPHITIAYLTPGSSGKYLSSEFKGRRFKINRLTYSDKERNHTDFSLKKNSVREYETV